MFIVTSKLFLEKLVAGGKLTITEDSTESTIKGAIGALLMTKYPFLDLGILSDFTVKLKDKFVEIRVPVEDDSSTFSPEEIKTAIM